MTEPKTLDEILTALDRGDYLDLGGTDYAKQAIRHALTEALEHQVGTLNPGFIGSDGIRTEELYIRKSDVERNLAEWLGKDGDD